MATKTYRQSVLKHPAGFVEILGHPFLGVDLRADPKYSKPGSLLVCQNFLPYEQFIAEQRKGTVFLNAVAWPGVNRVPFALRFYKDAATRFKLVCVNKDAGDEIGSVHDTTGAYTALTGPVLSPNTRWRGIVSMEVQTAYFGNDTDPLMKTTDGLTYAALAGTKIPAKGYIAGPYFDRILAFTGKRVYYSRSNNDADWSNAGGGVMYLFVNHPEDVSAVFLPGPDRTDVGYSGKLYVCTPTSTWLHHLDFEETAGTPTDSFTKIHESAGVTGVNTMAWTDQGVVALGLDNVWFFPIDGLPYPIGSKIQPIIKQIPALYRHRCSGAYREGFYYLSYVRDGQTSPDREFVADLRSMSALSEDYGVLWYGPHVRENIGIECFLLQSQMPDNNELFAFGAAEGRCMQLEIEVYTDNGVATESLLTPMELGSQIRGLKSFPGFVLGVEISDDDSVEVYYDVDGGRKAGVKTISIPMGGATWAEPITAPSDAIWDVSVFAGAFYTVIQRFWGTKPLGSRVRLTLKHTSDKRIRVKEFSALANLFGRVAP